MSNVESNFALSVPSFVMLGTPVVLVLVFWFRELQFGVRPPSSFLSLSGLILGLVGLRLINYHAIKSASEACDIFDWRSRGDPERRACCAPLMCGSGTQRSLFHLPLPHVP